MCSMRRTMKLLVVAAIVSSLGWITISSAGAQSYPTREIEMIVPYPPGGSSDLIARFLGEPLKKELGQPVLSINKPGAGGTVGWKLLASAKPDGYTFGITTKALMIQKYTTSSGLDYKRVLHVARLASSLGVLAVQQNSPWETLDDFLAAARKEPGKLSIGNSGAGATWHLFAAAIENEAKVKFNHIPYGGGNPAVVALAGGQIDAISMDLGTVVPLLPMKRIRILAINGNERHPKFPNVPTFRERGLSIALDHWTGVAAPMGTPPDVIKKVEDALDKATSTPQWKEFIDRFLFIPSLVKSAQLGPMLEREDAWIASLISKIGYKQ